MVSNDTNQIIKFIDDRIAKVKDEKIILKDYTNTSEQRIEWVVNLLQTMNIMRFKMVTE